MSSLGLDKGTGGGVGGGHIFLIFVLATDDSSVKVTLFSRKTFLYMKGNSGHSYYIYILNCYRLKL